MEMFPIRGFRPIEGKEDSTDQDRTVLRTCEGLVPFPQGALCAGPEWKLLWGQSAIKTDIEAVLAGADVTKAHFVTVAKNGHTFLCCWSMSAHRALGWFYLSGSPSNQDLDATGSVVITATNNAVYRDKHATALWFGSPLADRLVFGNGVDVNIVWYSSALALFGPSSTPADVNKRSRVRFPPCIAFRKHVNGSILAGGNAATPMRTWISDAPNAGEPFVDGVYSLSTSFIDVTPHGGATRITGLSVFQQYVTVHTDKAPVNLYGVDTTANGWKCDQSPSAANASAINPSCLGDNLQGDAAFYLGADLEVYLDQAIRSGPFEKRSARAQDIATEQGASLWNQSAMRPPLSYGYHTVYDRENRLFWMFMPNAYDSRPALYVYNERTRTVSGPWRYPAAVVSCLLTSLGTSTVAIITAAGECLYARLGAIGETKAENMEAKGTALGAPYAIGTVAPTPVAGVPYVSADALSTVFIETAAGSSVGLATPLGPVATLVPGGYTLTQFWNDAYLARFETPWMDLGDPDANKNFLGLRITFDRDARAYVGLASENERGVKRWKWYGSIHGRGEVFIPCNLFGRRVRFRVVAVCFNAGRLLIKDCSIGYTGGNIN